MITITQCKKLNSLHNVTQEVFGRTKTTEEGYQMSGVSAGEIILKFFYRKQDVKVWTLFIWFKTVPNGGSYERGNNTSGSIKDGGFQFLNDYCDPRRYLGGATPNTSGAALKIKVT